MNYENEWKALRDVIYATLKEYLRVGTHSNEFAFSILFMMIDVEDITAGIDIAPRHDHRITDAEVIALYEARER